MSKFVGFLQISLKKFDFLSASQFIRYKGQSEYKTATGGMVTLTVIAISIALFANMGLLTINKQIINSSASYSMSNDPQHITFKMNPENKFMITVGIFLLDFNDPNVRYFDVHLYQRHYSPIYQLINQTKIPLTQCTLDHFDFSQQMKNNYYKLNISKNLCSPMDYQYVVGGKATSSVYSELELSVEKCNSTLHNNCASDATLQYLQSVLGAFTIGFGVINTLVNPADVDYLKIFLEDRNYFPFSPFSSNGVLAIAEIQSIQVNTDQTLMPYSVIKNQQYVSIPTLMIEKTMLVYKEKYLKVIFTKSSRQTIYTRSFNKIDNYLSYIGGLIGTAFLVCFFINKFAQISYVLDLSGEIFQKQPDSQEKIGSMFNFFSYICLYVYSWLLSIKIKLNWQKTLKFKSYLKETQQKLSIQYILKKIMFLDEAISVLLNDEQIITLYFKEKKSIEQFQQKRKQQEIYLEMQTHKTKKIKNIQDNQQQTNMQLNKNQNLNNFEVLDLNTKERQLSESINQHTGPFPSKHDKDLVKKAICKVMDLKEQGDVVSERILQNISKNKLKQLGLLQNDQSLKTLRAIKIVSGAVSDSDKKKDGQNIKKILDEKLIIEQINSQKQQIQNKQKKKIIFDPKQ